MRTQSSSLRDLGIALSLANLCLLRMWAFILCPPVVGRLQHVAAIADTLVVAVFLWAAARLARRSRSAAVLTAARALLVLAVLASLPGVARALRPAIETTGWFSVTRALFLALSVLLIAAAAAAAKLPSLSAVTCRALLALLPAVLVTFGQSSRHLANLVRHSVPMRVVGPTAAAAPERHDARPARPRVVVLLLDELDYDLAFLSRSPSVKLPALDQFRREALWATNAYPPEMWTSRCIPACVTGRLVENSNWTPQGGVVVLFHGGKEFVPLSEQPNLFSELHREGTRCAAIGFEFPYAGVFQRDAVCVDPRRGGAVQARLTEEMFNNALQAARDSPFPLPPAAAAIQDRLIRQAGVRAYQAFVRVAEKWAADPALGFVFLHAPVPHPPYIYDRDTGRITSAAGRTYLDNLVLADRTLARIRSAMEADGEWESATVVVMSDHWKRARPAGSGQPDHRVLFTVKMGKQRAGMAYARPLNVVLVHDLVLAIMREQVQRPGDIARWLDKHATIGESPLTAHAPPMEESPLADWTVR